MPKISLDNVDYNTEDLSDQGLAYLESLQFVENQINLLCNEITVYQTAQKSYISILKAEICASGIEPASGNDPSD